jgi:hypothetical protein
LRLPRQCPPEEGNLTDPHQRLTAALAGRYAILREIGSGGMATVYLAEALFASARQEFATDGQRLYLTADDRQSDIKVMEVRRPE